MRFWACLTALLLFPLVALAASPTIDGSGFHSATGNGSNSATVSATTTSTNDIIVLFVVATNSAAPAPSVSSVSGASLTWTNRGAAHATMASGQCSGVTTCAMDVEEWWAFSSGTLTSQTITVNYGGTVTDSTLFVFGVHGVANTAAPFDTNAGLPVTAFNATSSAASQQTTFSTSQADDLIVGFGGSATVSGYAAGTQTCSGWSVSAGLNNANKANMVSEDKSVSAVQSSITMPFYQSGCAQLSNVAWGALTDALTNGGSNAAIIIRSPLTHW